MGCVIESIYNTNQNINLLIFEVLRNFTINQNRHWFYYMWKKQKDFNRTHNTSLANIITLKQMSCIIHTWNYIFISFLLVDDEWRQSWTYFVILHGSVDSKPNCYYMDQKTFIRKELSKVPIFLMPSYNPKSKNVSIL